MLFWNVFKIAQDYSCVPYNWLIQLKTNTCRFENIKVWTSKIHYAERERGCCSPSWTIKHIYLNSPPYFMWLLLTFFFFSLWTCLSFRIFLVVSVFVLPLYNDPLMSSSFFEAFLSYIFINLNYGFRKTLSLNISITAAKHTFKT